MPDEPRTATRRSILAAFAGAVTVSIAQALGRPDSVRAEGEAMVVGGNYPTATTDTDIANLENGNNVFYGRSVAVGGKPGSGGGVGVSGHSSSNYGVSGISFSSAGVHGSSRTGFGVFGESDDTDGVHGHSDTERGVSGYSLSGIGVHGETAGEGDTADTQAGVQGRATGVGTRGVYGVHDFAVGFGVFGKNEENDNYGYLGGRAGVAGFSPRGGYALRTRGRLDLSTSGLTAIPTGTNSRLISLNFRLDGTSKVIATLESNQPGLAIQRIVKDVANDRFAVHLNANVGNNRYAKVAWLVLG